MQSYFLKLLHYDKWATTLLLEVFDQKPADNSRINELLSHMQSVQRIWLDRCQNRKETVQRFQYRTQEEIWKDMQQCNADWIDYIQSLESTDFDLPISYINFQGDHFTTALNDIITQVINHGTHHRGNIVILMKEEDYPLPILDYISFVRFI
ncbi:MAG: DinB family protein [Bacteroidota bacterium]